MHLGLMYFTVSYKACWCELAIVSMIKDPERMAGFAIFLIMSAGGALIIYKTPYMKSS